MQTSLSSRFSKLAIAMACTTLLAACGGGGNGDSNDTGSNTGGNNGGAVSPAPAPELSAGQILEQQKAGLTSTANAYNLALSIGDTWRLVLDPAAKTYTLTVVQTAFAAGQLSNGAVHTGFYAVGADGELGAANGDWELLVDANTQSVTGGVRGFAGQPIVIGGKPVIAQVNGTSYAAPADLSRFKGTYFVSGAMRNAGNGAFPWSYAGQLRVADDGKSYQLCANGLFNAQGKCSAVEPNQEVSEGSFNLVSDPATGLIRVKDSTGGDQGVMTFQLNGLGGYTLIHDRIGRNEEGVLRTGVAYASSAVALKSGDLDGSFKCKNAFQSSWSSSITIAGGTVRIAEESPNGYQATENLTYNQFRSAAGTLVDLPGIVEASPAGRPNDGAILHPISRNTLVVERDDEDAQALCSRAI
ncbi:hypothetical protein [Comamonas endophytica]|uniref:Lipoprotein n=1 Tax=Comamonas endophytica TaxID=2949090 RepID=A0ABY6G799_9BURK|nr:MULTISPECIES: hypothetical protein [unclassified Acidovorax]MCD2511523.1 hypothetical protein [Acidovorax sp. D4N7]UYG50909.1 hypothetical protein M9799_12520 [Acidovorax sp. 5MLIR]